MLDPPVPRMALKKQGAGSFKHGSTPLPAALPEGIMPPEDSRIWLFVPKCVQRGQEFVQDDTRAWFEDRERKVAISRSYIDHPRWLIGGVGDTIRGKLFNGSIVSEVHLLARHFAGLPDFPEWVYASLSVRQAQAEVGWRITKLTRLALMKHGPQAMEDFATRAPGQFIKFVASTFVPRKLETETIPRAGESMDSETADAMIAALAAEIRRREIDMKIIAVQGGNDYEEVKPMEAFQQIGQDMKDAALSTNAQVLHPRSGDKRFNPRNVRDMLNPEAEEIIEVEPEDEQPDHEWD